MTSGYRSSPTRRRRSKAEMERIREALCEILEEDEPMTVRQVFYRAVSAGVVSKTEREYKSTVCRLLTDVPSAEILAGFEQETPGVTRSSAVAASAAEMEERCQAVRHPPGVDPRPRAKFVTRAPSAPRTVSRCFRCGRRPGSRPPSSPGRRPQRKQRETVRGAEGDRKSVV